MNVHTDATLVTAKLGQITDAFPTATDPSAVTAIPLPVIDIGTQTCQKILGLLGNCTTRTPFGAGGIGLSFDTVSQSPLGTAAATNTTFSSPNLPEINSPPYFLTNTTSVKPSTVLNGVVSGVKVDVYKPATSTTLGNVITGAATLLNSLTSALDVIVENTLKPLLTSVVDPLLASLGVTLAPADVGANLSCNFGQAHLVI